MSKKEQVKEFIKEHKKEILIGGCTIVGGVMLGKICSDNKSKPKLDHKVVIKTNSKEFSDTLTEMIKWGSGVPTDGAWIAWDCTKDMIDEKVSEFLSEDDSGKYLYSMVLERIDKDKLK